MEGHWERGATGKGGSLGKGYYGKVGHWKKGVTRKEVWGHQERSLGKIGSPGKGGK